MIWTANQWCLCTPSDFCQQRTRKWRVELWGGDPPPGKTANINIVSCISNIKVKLPLQPKTGDVFMQRLFSITKSSRPERPLVALLVGLTRGDKLIFTFVINSVIGTSYSKRDRQSKDSQHIEATQTETWSCGSAAAEGGRQGSGHHWQLWCREKLR